MKLIPFVVAAFVALGVWLPLYADEPQAEISANVLVPILIDGRESESIPAVVPLNTQVCVGTSLRYIAADERQRFDSWFVALERGSVGTNLIQQLDPSLDAECIQVTEPGRYTAKYIHEVLFQVRSDVDSFQQSRWVSRGEVVELEVPELVTESPRVRYRFLRWGAGETPFTANNRIAVLRPTVLDVLWAVEYNVTVEDLQGNPMPPSGWHAGQTELVLRSEPVIDRADGQERLNFRRWEVVYGPLLKRDTDSAIAIRVQGPSLIRPEYTESYLIEASNFQGPLLKQWVEAGNTIRLRTPETIETDPERKRYVFKEWLGADNLQGSEVDLLVNGPLTLEAVYERQFKLTVVSPYGASGDGWYQEGAKTFIMAPDEPQSMLFFSRKFDGFLGYRDDKLVSGTPVAEIVVDKPMTITAVYRSEINSKVLFLLVGVIVAGILVYAGTEWGPDIYRRLRRRVPA